MKIAQLRPGVSFRRPNGKRVYTVVEGFTAYGLNQENDVVPFEAPEGKTLVRSERGHYSAMDNDVEVVALPTCGQEEVLRLNLSVLQNLIAIADRLPVCPVSILLVDLADTIVSDPFGLPSEIQIEVQEDENEVGLLINELLDCEDDCFDDCFDESHAYSGLDACCDRDVY